MLRHFLNIGTDYFTSQQSRTYGVLMAEEGKTFYCASISKDEFLFFGTATSFDKCGLSKKYCLTAISHM